MALPLRPLLFAAVLFGLVSAAQAQSDRPNLILVVTDDQRHDQLGAAGHPFLETPTMDRLAQDGVRFRNAFVTTAICAASRATILTGRTEGRHNYTFGKPAMGKALADESYPMRLREAGYRTGFVGKWGVRYEKGVMKEAFDLFRPMSPPYRREGKAHLSDRIGEVASKFVNEKDERPFCLSISFNAPHAQDSHPDQYLPPADLAELYEDVEVPVPTIAETGFEALPKFLQESLGRERWYWRFDTREKQIRRTKDYWAMLTGLDRALGRVLEAVEAAGQAENTVVVLIGDNGYFLGERGLAGKWLIYEESIRVPLIVFDPRAKPEQRGVVRDEMVLNLDIAPTLLALAGLDAPEPYSGASLVPLLQGESPEWRSDFLHEHRFAHKKIPQNVGVRGQRFVYARFDTQEPVYEQLFDLRNDPYQLKNLASDADFAEVLAEMRARCDELAGK